MSTGIDKQHRPSTDVGKGRDPAACPGVVRVLTSHRDRRRAMCRCGGIGRPRLLQSHGVLGALLHAARARRPPAVPLVDVGRWR